MFYGCCCYCYIIPFPLHHSRISPNMRLLRSSHTSSSSSCKRKLRFEADASSAKKNRYTSADSAIKKRINHFAGSNEHRNVPKKEEAVRDQNHSAIYQNSLTLMKMHFESTPPKDTVVDASSAAVLYEGTYPPFARPSPEECIQVWQKLWQLHGPLEEYAKHRNARISNPQIIHFEQRNQNMPKCEADSMNELQESSRSGFITKDVKDRDARASSYQMSALTVGHNNLKVPKIEENSTDIVELRNFVPSSDTQARKTVLDSLIATILSQNTTDRNSRRAFAQLKSRFPSWKEVYEAAPKEIEDVIRCAGLAEKKTSRILNILSILQKEQGKLCLEYIKGLPTDVIKQELTRFKGVGPKTVACVLMFHLQRNEFPVDTHIFRITKMLGWVPANANREKAYLHLNNCIPDELKFDLHCLFVTHGKRCPRCAAGGRIQQPADGPCPLSSTDVKSLQHLQ